MRSAIILCLILAIEFPVIAQTLNRVTVTTDTVEFVMGTGFTAEEAYNRVLARAKRLAVDKAAATYIQSYRRVENYILTQDIIDAVHAGTVIDYDILWKNDDAEESGVHRIVMKAVVECPSIDELRRAVEEKSPYEVGVKRGELYVNSYPPGATIYIDGDKQVTRTPHTFRELEEGMHDITLRMENYRPETKTIRISQTDPQMINVILKRPRGRIKITSNVRGAGIQLDNKYIGTTPITTNELLAGIHDLTVTGLEEYEPYTAEVEIRVDETNKVDVILRKRTGNILVFTDPPGARVSLTGTGLSGIANDSYTFRNLEPITYEVIAEIRGYYFKPNSVILKPGKTETVELFGLKAVQKELEIIYMKQKLKELCNTKTHIRWVMGLSIDDLSILKSERTGCYIVSFLCTIPILNPLFGGYSIIDGLKHNSPFEIQWGLNYFILGGVSNYLLFSKKEGGIPLLIAQIPIGLFITVIHYNHDKNLLLKRQELREKIEELEQKKLYEFE